MRQINKDTLVFVFYINVGNLSTDEVQRVIEDVNRRLTVNKGDVVNYIIPVKNSETRVECINPKLASEEEFQDVIKKLDEYEGAIIKFLNPEKLPCSCTEVCEGHNCDDVKPVKEKENWFLKFVDKLAKLFNVETIQPVKDETYTCATCQYEIDCDFAWDEYNKNGDCLKEK